MKRKDIQELVNVAEDLFAKGNQDPSAGDIARAFIEEGTPLSLVVFHAVQDVLPYVVSALRWDKKHEIVPLARTFYENNRVMPRDEDAARAFVAGGRNKNTVGIHFVTDPKTDTLYRCSTARIIKNGKVKATKNMEKVAGLVERGLLSPVLGQQLVKTASEPASVTLAALLDTHYPDPDGHALGNGGEGDDE